VTKNQQIMAALTHYGFATLSTQPDESGYWIGLAERKFIDLMQVNGTWRIRTTENVIDYRTAMEYREELKQAIQCIRAISAAK
jgi:hypothetical protein